MGNHHGLTWDRYDSMLCVSPQGDIGTIHIGPKAGEKLKSTWQGSACSPPSSRRGWGGKMGSKGYKVLHFACHRRTPRAASSFLHDVCHARAPRAALMFRS